MENNAELPQNIKNRATCDLPSSKQEEERSCKPCAEDPSTLQHWSLGPGTGPTKVPTRDEWV